MAINNLEHGIPAPKTAQLICRQLRLFLDMGCLTLAEYEFYCKHIRSLARNGEPAPVIEEKLLTSSEAAELLSISHSQFRALVSEGYFPFQRKMIGAKNVRYRKTDILKFIAADEEIPTPQGGEK